MVRLGPVDYPIPEDLRHGAHEGLADHPRQVGKTFLEADGRVGVSCDGSLGVVSEQAQGCCGCAEVVVRVWSLLNVVDF